MGGASKVTCLFEVADGQRRDTYYSLAVPLVLLPLGQPRVIGCFDGYSYDLSFLKKGYSSAELESFDFAGAEPHDICVFGHGEQLGHVVVGNPHLFFPFPLERTALLTIRAHRLSCFHDASQLAT
jgi:hypothetical protein